MPRKPDGERAQAETNQSLGRIEKTLETSSRLFELMHERLGHLEAGQTALVERQRSLVDGQRQVIQRLDKLVDVIVRDRTARVDRFTQLEDRLAAVEARLPANPPHEP